MRKRIIIAFEYDPEFSLEEGDPDPTNEQIEKQVKDAICDSNLFEGISYGGAGGGIVVIVKDA